jgi:Poly(ADP-ribose) polymerase and DNA-Ligase Zn-finger region
MTDSFAEQVPEAEPAAAEAAEPKVMLEPASSGRAGCRACANKIAKGELRLGERLPNPYTETDTTYWFHAICAVHRRPESLLKAIAAGLADGTLPADPLTAEQRALAECGVKHYRLARITRLEVAPSGRARCRHCKEAIANAELRLALTIFQEGRFDPIGFLHAKCATAYFGTALEMARLEHYASALPPEQQQLVRDTFA